MATLPSVEVLHRQVDEHLTGLGLLAQAIEEIVTARRHRAQAIQNEHLAGFLTRKVIQELGTSLISFDRVRELLVEVALVAPSERHAELAVKCGMLAGYLSGMGRAVADEFRGGEP